MKRIDKIGFILAALLIAAIPVAQVLATCTYTTQVGSGVTVASCNETTEAGPTLISHGKPLDQTRGLVVSAVHTSAMTAGGTFQAWTWVPTATQWVRTPDLDLVAAAATNQTWAAFQVLVPRGRIDYRPSGVGAGNTLIYISGY